MLTELPVIIFQLGGWHTIVMLIFHTKASLGIDNKGFLTASFKNPSPPINLDQVMKVGFMGKRIVSMKQAVAGGKKKSLISLDNENSLHLRKVRNIEIIIAKNYVIVIN